MSIRPGTSLSDPGSRAATALRDARDDLMDAAGRMGQPRRRSRGTSAWAVLAGALAVLVVLAVGVRLAAAWSSRLGDDQRSWSKGPGGHPSDSPLDREAMERAAGEGMGTAPGTELARRIEDALE